MDSIKQKTITLILALSFLIESPLRTTIHSILALSQPLAYLVINIVFYVALFACFIIVLKPDITSKSVMKSIVLVSGFFVLEQIISLFLFTGIIALVYEIFRPLIIFAIILLGNCWIVKCKFCFNKFSWIILSGAFILGALFNILENIRTIIMMQNVGDNFFSYLSLLTQSNSVYSIMAKLCTYVFILVLFVKNENLKN